MKHLSANRPDWLHPDDFPPPRATKLLLYSKTGITLTGHWGTDCLLWMPLPKVSAQMRARLEGHGRQ